MAITNVTTHSIPEKGITYTHITDTSADWTGITNDTYFYNLEDDLPYYKNASGTVIAVFEEGGTDTNDYTTGSTLVGTTLYFDRTDSLSAYTADLSSIGGEVNTASNVGSGEAIFSGKSGVDLQFKSLTSTGGTVTISSTGATVNLESPKPTLSKTFTLDAPTSSDDVTIFRTDVAITVQEVIAVSVGTTPSTTYQLKHSTDRSAAGNALTTSGTSTSTTTGDTATLSDATIPADSWVWFESTAASGTNVVLTIDIRYTID